MRRIVSLACATAMAAAGLHAQQPRPTAGQIKAAYLYSFGKFVGWPDTPATAKGAFPICVLGRDPFGNDLDDVLKNAAVGGQPVVARRLPTLGDAPECRVLYVASSEAAQLGTLLTKLENSPVLTVSDLPDFTARGGMIRFVADGNRVRFEINLASAQAAGLTMSSDLLRVATAVRK